MSEMDFDWVTATVSCSPDRVLRLLESQSESDVSKRNLIRNDTEKHYGVSYEIQKRGFGFEVLAVTTMGGRDTKGSVRFSPASTGIKVEYSESLRLDSFVGELVLDILGECKISVGKYEGFLSFWQFRKIALEPILFDCYKELRR